jgi:predicted HAD superfamily Cof-like phosphohydrolase
MKTMFEKVRDFHEAFGQRIGEKPELPDSEFERALRIKLMSEEHKEYNKAEDNNDITNLAVELADIIYIACGTAVSYGIPLDEVFNAIHAANMNKLVDGKVILREDGKIKKPDGWQPADIEGILKKYS